MKIARKTARSRNLHQIDVLERRRLLSAAISFASHTDFTAGGDPVAIVADDFNNDGNMDIAVADTSPNQIAVFYGNGLGGFSAGPILPVSGVPTALITGEFNSNNTFPDLAVGCSPGGVNTGTTVTVFVNNAGTFALGQTTTVFTGATANEPIALSSGDFNGDGFLDIAATEFSNNSIAILLGTGSGTFQTPVPYNVDNNPTSIVTADFNGDGKLDLAVADTDTITNSDMSTSSVNAVTFLQGNGAGTFTIAARQQLDTTAADGLATADLNNDNKPDLIVASADSSSDVFLNNGQFQFTESAVYALAGPGNSIAAADFNGDNDTDLIYTSGGSELTSVNEISIAAGAGDGTISNFSDAPTGQEPVAVVAADFNRDGKPDLAVADDSGGQVSILLNTSADTILKSTQIVLQDDSSTAPYGQTVDFTATVTTSGTGFDTGTPDGTVEFFVNNKPADMETLDNTGTAVFSTSTLAVGADVVYAQYLGDSTFAKSTSTSLDQTITPTAGHGPDLAGSFIASTVPSIIIPGQKINVKVRVTNQGNTIAQGTITNDVFLSLDNTLDSGDIFVPLTGPLAQPKVNLKPGASITLSGTLVIPTDAPTSNYILLADLNDTQTLLESDYSNDVVVAPSMSDDEDDFGLINGHSTALTLADSDGTPVTYKLTGPGIGTVTVGDDGTDVSLTGTTAGSSVTMTASGPINLNSITAASTLGSIKAPLVNLGGFATLSGGIGTLVLGNVTGQQAEVFPGGVDNDPNGRITIGAGPTSSITLGSVVAPAGGVAPFFSDGFELVSTSPIRSLTVTSWSLGTSGDQLVAPSIGTLICKQDFDANLSGSSTPTAMALHTATIGGTVSSFSWSLSGNVAKISIGSTVAPGQGALSGWSVGIVGQLQSLNDNGVFHGDLAATNIGSISIRGDVIDSMILPGANFGAAAEFGISNGASFGPGSLHSLRIGGSVTDSLIAAGLDDPDYEFPLDSTASLLAGGAIKSISINGSVDSVSRLLADSLPPKVQIDGTVISPAADPRFQI